MLIDLTLDRRQFAASGECGAEEKNIIGKVIDDITFVSNEFTGTMNSQKFWDDLRMYAHKNNAFIKLMY